MTSQSTRRHRPLSLLLTSVGLALAASVSALAADKAKVTARSGLNMRSRPTTSASRIRTLRPKEQVTIVRTQGKWALVETERGKRGWAFGKYLQVIPSSSSRRTTRAGNHGGMTARIIDLDDRRDSVPIRDVSPANTRSPSREPVTRTSTRNANIDRRNLSGLQPSLRAKVERVLARLQAKGWKPYVAEGRRTLAQQREKVRRGVSRTMRSRHLTGNAADIVDRRYGWGGPARNQSFQFWKDLGAAARAEGLRWGGDWRRFKDVAHVQS